jgi:CDP-diacylglycerol--serine O-phosphatidyltransferase
MTASSLVLGFFSLLLLLHDEARWALSLFALTLLLDRLDGIVARSLHQESEFGKQLDSLVDCANFCVVPVLGAWLLGFNSPGAVVILPLYLLAGASRLAHFNIQGMEESDGKKFFSGIPTTMAAGWFLIIASLCLTYGKAFAPWMYGAFFIVAAVLMVSPLRIDKNGWLVKSLFLLIPCTVAILWISPV